MVRQQLYAAYVCMEETAGNISHSFLPPLWALGAMKKRKDYCNMKKPEYMSAKWHKRNEVMLSNNEIEARKKEIEAASRRALVYQKKRGK